MEATKHINWQDRREAEFVMRMLRSDIGYEERREREADGMKLARLERELRYVTRRYVETFGAQS